MKRHFHFHAVICKVFLALNSLWCFLPNGVRAQPASPAMRSVAELEQKWSTVSSEDLRKAAETGNAEAQYFFGSREWKAAYKEVQTAWNWMERAESGGKPLTDGERQASESHWRDLPEPDLRKAAQSEDGGARWALGKLSYTRACARALKAFEWFQRAAEQSLPYAEHEVGIQLLGHLGWSPVTTNQTAGLKWLQRAAGHGFEPAQHKLADLYIEGQIIPPDIVKGIESLQAAAAGGCARAQYQLALHYASGEGEPQHDGETPITLLQRAARSGHALAWAALGDRYRTGFGVQKDLIRAIRYYQAAQDAEAQSKQEVQSQVAAIFALVDQQLEPRTSLSREYVRFAEVLSLYRKATQRSDTAAMTRLGELCLTGSLTPERKVEAYRWFNRAAERGHAPARKARDELQQRMTRDELNQAARPAEESL